MTGTDEHGSKIQQAASQANSVPKDYCDKISNEYKELFKHFQIDHSSFIRTTDDQHIRAVHSFWVSI